MICNICGTKDASIHLTEIVNGQMAEIHICEQCAEEKGTDFKTYFNFGDLLTGFAGTDKNLEASGNRSVLICKNCGMAYEDFSKHGRLGCAACYEAFQKQLAAVIKQVQRSSYHVGKKPGNISKDTRSAHDLRQLQERLRKSVQSEAFEEAAQIRDEIKKAEEKLKRSKKASDE